MQQQNSRSMSYACQTEILKHFDYIKREQLSAGNKNAQRLNRTVPFSFGDVSTQVTFENDTWCLRLAFAREQTEKLFVSWKFQRRRLTIRFLKELDVENSFSLMGVKQYSNREYGVEDFYQLLKFYFNRPKTRVDFWRVEYEIPEIKFSQPISLGVLKLDDNYSRKMITGEIPFFNSIKRPLNCVIMHGLGLHEKTHELLLNAKSACFDYFRRDISGLGNFNSINMELRNVFTDASKISSFFITLMLQNRPIGFHCTLHTSEWFNFVVSEIEKQLFQYFDSTWYNSWKCATIERDKDEVNIYTKLTSKQHTICFAISEKGFAQKSNFSENRQLSQSALRNVVKSLKFAKRKGILNTETLKHLWNTPMNADTVLVQYDEMMELQVIIDGLKTSSSRTYRLMFIKEMTIHVNNIERRIPRGVSVDHLILTSPKPYSSELVEMFRYGSVNKLTALNPLVLINCVELIQKALVVEFTDSNHSE